MREMNRAAKLPVLIAYILAFYLVWTIWELWGSSLIDRAIESEFLAQLVKSGVVKNLVWTVPALFLIHRFQSEVFISLREMFSAKVDLPKLLPVLIFFTLYILAGSILKNGRPKIADHFGPGKGIIVLFVGLTEETVFRGWLLNATVREDQKRLPILLNAAMFLAIHFPKWIHSGVFIRSFMNLQFLELLALSVVFSRAFLKSRSILVPIALHMYWDLLVFMLI